MIVFSLLFVGLSSLLGCLGALAVGQLVPAVSAGSLLIAFGVAAYLSKQWKLEFKSAPVAWPVALLYSVIATGIYFHSTFLFFKKGEMYWIQNPFNLGDMSFHWGTINYLAKGAHFWPENPIYLGYRFKYPFGMDFFNSLWGNLGVGIEAHLPLVTLAMLILCFVTLHFLGGPLLVFAVFFSGGYFNYFAVQDWDLNRLQESLDFKNLFLTVLLTQRGFLFALPAGVFLYHCVQKSLNGAWRASTLEKISVGLIWGSLGFFHLHSFFFISAFLGLLILLKKDLKNWWLPIATASVLGIPFVINALWPESGTMPLIHWSKRGWNRPEDLNYFVYWMRNLGPWLLALAVSAVVFYQKRRWSSLQIVGISFFFFVLFSHLILAPWAWDNIKLLLWCYIFAFMAMTELLWTERSAGFKAALFAVFFIPGFLLFTRSLPAFYHGTTWASEKDLNRAKVALQGQDVNAGLVIAPHYEHPALLLGYKLFMGYPGHVWSHGYNYVVREELINKLYAGDSTALSALKEGPLKGKVGLIYRGSLEKRRESAPFSEQGLLKIGEAMDHDLYRLQNEESP